MRDKSSAEVAAFIAAIAAVCEQHQMSIAHEDGHGAFIIEGFYEANIDWLRDAIGGRGVARA